VRIRWRDGTWVASIKKGHEKLDQIRLYLNQQLTKTTGTQYSMDSEDNFEWDRSKAASNRAKHGISFEEAKGIFRDPDPIDLLDTRADYGEERYIRIAMTEGKVLFVVYTERDGRIRLISARKAEKDEQDRYYRQKATGWEGIE